MNRIFVLISVSVVLFRILGCVHEALTSNRIISKRWPWSFLQNLSHFSAR